MVVFVIPDDGCVAIVITRDGRAEDVDKAPICDFWRRAANCSPVDWKTKQVE
jgi:hypothetical protein